MNTHLFLIRTEVILGNCRAIPGRERSEAFLSFTSDRPANKSPMPGGPGGAFEVSLAPPAIGWRSVDGSFGLVGPIAGGGGAGGGA